MGGFSIDQNFFVHSPVTKRNILLPFSESKRHWQLSILHHSFSFSASVLFFSIEKISVGCSFFSISIDIKKGFSDFSFWQYLQDDLHLIPLHRYWMNLLNVFCQFTNCSTLGMKLFNSNVINVYIAVTFLVFEILGMTKKLFNFWIVFVHSPVTLIMT